MGLREQYGLPEHPPFATWLIVLITLVSVAVLVLWWLALPHTALTVALLCVVIVALVFGGVFRLLSSRAFEQPPGRSPREPR